MSTPTQPSHIGCVIISNSDDFHFLDANLKQIHTLFHHIVIAIGTKLWNGEPENPQKIDDFIKATSATYTNVTFQKYNVPEDKIPFMENNVRPTMYWEAHARWVSLKTLDASCDYVMFLDSDEVIDGTAFGAWIESGLYRAYDAMKLANYWYWRDICYRAKEYLEDSVVFIKRSTFNPLTLFSNVGRQGVFDACKSEKKCRVVKGCNDAVMVHHFSWVRDKEAMLRKVKNWGHRDDPQDWVGLVEREFSAPFTGKDFLAGHTYETVPDMFAISFSSQ